MKDPIEAAVAQFLAAQGISQDHPELKKTPARVAALWRDTLLDGYRHDPQQILSGTIQDTPGGIITATNLPFHTVCPHHLMPAYGVVHLAYQSNGKIVGFGALQRLIDALAHRLTLQEHLTAQIVEALMTHLQARGVVVAIEAQHMCMVLQDHSPHRARIVTRFSQGTLEDQHGLLPPIAP